MNKIESGEKLDFQNVLIRPKRSTINSRSEVSLLRPFTFKYSPKTWFGIPIIAANMDKTGTFEVYETLSQHKIITAMHKFYSTDDYIQYKNTHTLDPSLFMVSTGISDADLEKLHSILEVVDCNWICVDIANGYIQK